MLSPKIELSVKNIKTDIPNIKYFIFFGILFNSAIVFELGLFSKLSNSWQIK